MQLSQPDLLCPRCGSVIPSNQQLLEAWDEQCAKARSLNQTEPIKPGGRGKMSLLGCEGCLAKASEGMPVVKHHRRIRNHPSQLTIDVPPLWIE